MRLYLLCELDFIKPFICNIFIRISFSCCGKNKCKNCSIHHKPLDASYDINKAHPLPKVVNTKQKHRKLHRYNNKHLSNTKRTCKGKQ